MWEYKEFKTRKDQENFIKNNEDKIQYEEIFINNGYAIIYRKLKIISFE